jgi:uncharacterized repeat protein (TIGR01451 family)
MQVMRILTSSAFVPKSSRISDGTILQNHKTSMYRSLTPQTRANLLRLASKPLKGLCSSLVALLCLASVCQQPAQAEGSRTLYPSTATGNRGSLLWVSDKYLGGKVTIRTIFKVYANAGEYINVGSTAVGAPTIGTYTTSNGDIAIYNPGGVSGSIGLETIPATPDFSCTAQRTSTGSPTLGRISSRIQELAGPDTITNAATGARGNDVPTGYVPCYYQAPSTGVYSVIFYPPNRTLAFAAGLPAIGVPTADITMAGTTNFDATQGTHVSAWDVTVRSALNKTMDNTGRLFDYYMAMRHGNNSLFANFSIYPVTLNGFQYRVDMRGLDPNGFIVYGNQSGFFDSDGITPLYKDILGSDDFLTTITGGASAQLPQFPSFINPPDSSALTNLGIPLVPIAPTVSTLSFAGNLVGNSSLLGAGGTFSYTSNVDHTYQIVISRDGINFDPTNPLNRVLRGNKTSGAQTVTWDGKDNSGTNFPVGYGYKSQLFVYSGEYHFPLIDAENSQGGPAFTLLNPPGACINGNCSTVFNDDRGYKLLNGTTVGTIGTVLAPTTGAPATPYSGVTGYDSSTSIQRAFSSLWGDKKGLDTWTYFPSTTLSTQINILATSPSLALVKRITSILRGSPAVEQIPLSYIDVTADPNDNAAGWPTQTATAIKDTGATPNTTNFSTLLKGIVTSNTVQPKDTVEYKIYFLSSGTADATNVALCDFIPVNSTYVTGSTQLVLGNTTTAITDSTADADGGFYPNGSPSYPAACTGTNNSTGAVLVNIATVLKSTGAGAPINSSGYIRFSTKIN